MKKIICLLLCLLMLPAAAPAEGTGLLTSESIDELEAEGIEVEGLDEEEEEAFDADPNAPSIEGLTPLYTTVIKPFTADGVSIRMRNRQSNDSEPICVLKKGDIITVYDVLPSFVLCEFEGNVGYVIRTWIDEHMTPIDPENTPPYGVLFPKYVATLTEKTDVYMQPSKEGSVNKIHPEAGEKVAILDFVDGFAKVLIWRNYGYIDARCLTDLIIVAHTDEPLSEETPIAAFSSFFEYNTGKSGNEGRCKNIARSCELMTRVMQPGESLDFNAQIGPYKRTNGYFPAPVLIDGGSQLGYGGGTCQSSSTLYNTIRQIPGFTVVYRKPHGPGCAKYLPMHQDAAVGNDSLNLVIRNDNPFPVRILAESKGEGSLCIQIFRGE